MIAETIRKNNQLILSDLNKTKLHEKRMVGNKYELYPKNWYNISDV
jgi:hypothetical protein